MALPGDVTIFTLTFGPYTDASGAVVTTKNSKGDPLTAKLHAVDLATGRRLNVTDVATGQVVVPKDLTVTIGSDGTGSIGPLPHTDNPGLSTVGFGYWVEWDIATGSHSYTPGNKRFAVPTASGATVDFDLLDVAAAVPGVLVPMGVSAGVADAAVSALVEDEDSDTQAALRATLVAPITARLERETLLHARVKVDPNTWTANPRAMQRCTFPTPDGSGVVVHPSMLFFPEGWNGHRWWAGVTPYTGGSSSVENPCIVVSDDGITWTVPAGVTNPLAAAPAQGYNSDPHLAIGPDGRLYYFFRHFADVGGTIERIKYMASVDGATWTSPAIALSMTMTTDSALSPSIWWDAAAGEWVLIAVQLNYTTGVTTIIRRTAPDLTTGFGAKTTVTVTPALPTGRRWWHMIAAPIGGQVVALLQDNAGLDGQMGSIYVAVSDDQGRTFRRALDRFGGAQMRDLYRCSLVPLLTGDGMVAEVFAGTLTTVDKVGVIRRADLFGLYAADVAAAVRKTYPWIIGDSFGRADSTTALGTADSGQAWTASTGTPGIIGGEAYAAVAGNTRALIDAGTPDYIASVVVRGVNSQAWLVLRAVDGGNYVRYGISDSGATLRWERIGAGGVTSANIIANIGPTGSGANTARRYLLSARVVGDLYQLFLDGQLMFEFTSTTGQTATLVGIQTDSAGTRFDGFTVREIAAV